MFASGDHACRSVTLWQHGLLDELRPHLEHKIVGYSGDNSDWAILMYDLTGHVFGWDNPPPPTPVPVFLDGGYRAENLFYRLLVPAYREC